MTPERRHDLYWLGYRSGQRLAKDEPNVDHLPALTWEAKFQTRAGYPFALGELRGYRQAADLPQPLYGHRVNA